MDMDYESDQEKHDEDYDGWGGDDAWEDEEDSSERRPRGSMSEALPDSLALERKYSFQVLEPESIKRRQTEVTEEVKELLGVSHADAGVLLRAYRWKKSKLVDDWLQDPDKVRRKNGVKRGLLSQEVQISESETGTFDCPVCTNAVQFADTYIMECRHRFCRQCWANWLRAEMEKGPTAIFSLCPAFKCGDVVPETVFSEFLTPAEFERYNQYALSSFVQGSANIKWCPGPNCGRAVEYPTGGANDVTCVCGYRFCFACERVAHRPVPCDLVEKWLQKNASESENTNWILANTKICPKCKVPIEKNQGCNHMSCRICKHEFCWLCKGDWSDHGSATGGFYKCNKYEENQKKGAVDFEQQNIDKAANALQRYLHYFTRYDNHAKAVKFAEKTLVQTEARMKELQDLKGVGFMDVQFLFNSVKTVISCRHVLQWTYAYGYYLPDGTQQKALYETYQEQLEKFCEHLHELSEKPLEELKDLRIRTDVINYTRVTERYRDNIISAIENNFQE
eukprot:TRINITY_DN3667_c0_g1_i1.p1 TRINITY_DN3667_c0_g1~~TRINITY_DN3667_c0_g1_i1.p1  ORF type:complete len:508 (+),score=78.56 TRINITY_DN3667_c0_g1_i1:116-1639(+)